MDWTSNIWCSSSLLLMVSISSMFATVFANSLIKGKISQQELQQEGISEETMETSLVAEVESAIGAGSASKRLEELEAHLAPMYAALPKDDHGLLSRAAVRYALNRFFVQRRGWYITRLQESRDHSRLNLVSSFLQKQVPVYIQDMFEKQFKLRRFGLHEISVLAATVEHLVHSEAVDYLIDVFQLHGYLPTSLLNQSEADDVLDTYMAYFILGEKIPTQMTEEVEQTRNEMPTTFDAWNATQEFMRNISQEVISSKASAEQKVPDVFDFASAATIVEKISEQFGSFQDLDCRKIKAALVAKDHEGTGRISLADFWNTSVDGGTTWQFQESSSYLRLFGALDESNIETPRVIIANYILCPANCLSHAASGFYSVCCMNECEGLLSNLEKRIAAPEASFEQLAALVAEMSSTSVIAPRNLSKLLLSRLEQVADAHGGAISLHGRLFAQWMHHAFPRDCPYPSISGTTKFRSPDEWQRDTGKKSVASKKERKRIISKTLNQTDQLGVDSLPWSPVEELLAVGPPMQVQSVAGTDVFSNSRNAMLFVVVAGMLCRFVHSTPALPHETNGMETCVI